MNDFKNVKILGVSIDFLIAFLIVIAIYAIYDWIKKNKIKYLKTMLLIVIIIFSIILYLLIHYNINEDRLESHCVAIIIVCVFMIFRAKHDNRGKDIIEIINNQSMWKKVHTYFFSQEFNEDELNFIVKKIEQIFNGFENKKYDKKIGVLFIWIKNNNKKISIKLINQLDYFCESYMEDIVETYNNIKENTNGKLSIKGEKDKKIELFLEFPIE